MKPCSKCGAVKPLEEFYVTVRARDGKTSRCKPCIDQDQAQRYAANRDGIMARRMQYVAEHREHINALRRGRVQARRDQLDVIKAELGCAECGEDDPCCLQWHHRDPSTKTFAISDAIRDMRISIDEILLEAEKCDVLCANHHLKTHAHSRTGWA